MELVLAGALALFVLARRRKPGEDESGAPPEDGPSSSAPPQQSGGVDLGKLGEVGVGVVTGALVGDYFAQNFTTQPFTQRSGALVGGGIGGGAVLVIGGTKGALALAGGSLLTAGAILVIPAIALIAAVLGTMNAVESRIRMARYLELRDLVQARIAHKDWYGAWDLVVKAAEEGYPGLAWSGGGAPDDVRLAPGSKVEFVDSSTGEVVKTYTGKAPVKELMQAAYAELPGDEPGANIARGQKAAAEIQATWPWLNTYRRENGRLVQPLEVLSPGRYLRATYEPGFFEREGIVRNAEPAFVNAAELARFKQELRVEVKTAGRYAV